MEPSDLPALPPLLDIAGIAIFALSGAIAAAREKQTFVTLAFFALITGVGGGTVRDLLIGVPVFWVHDPLVAPICLATALVVWFAPGHWWSARLLDWADAAGLAAYAVLGTIKALHVGLPPIPAVLMGVITGCVGGIIRDVLAGRPSILMRPELYVTAAALAATLAAAGWLGGLPLPVTWTVAVSAGFALRGAAIHWSLALPAYSRGPKDEPPDMPA
ncbi:trimeric intracellular cation channel family protein [Novosphingobium album (ex Liu et al. 2023)]|uniref:TRIC cation channel family protein n=1 Tax=Novosphingobium album (ex Liu et al. 2023) TaxID=3031130 RepID=A0ABT5WNE2_9SPHN|nr:TRIC cation channel family protein [Novosphingobium album (ex Liu et al. 2023)]MDE8651389.1 TRIC cation channel family protein [Novosphingobium album (ex Liu et al. 2023)]